MFARELPGCGALGLSVGVVSVERFEFGSMLCQGMLFWAGVSSGDCRLPCHMIFMAHGACGLN